MSEEDKTSKHLSDDDGDSKAPESPPTPVASPKDAKSVESNPPSTLPSGDIQMDQDLSDGFQLVSRGKKRGPSSPSHISSSSKRASPTASTKEPTSSPAAGATSLRPCKFCLEPHDGKQCYLRQLGYLRPIPRSDRRQRPGNNCRWCFYGPHNGNECPNIGIARMRLAERRQLGLPLPPQGIWQEPSSKPASNKRDGTVNPLTLSPASKKQIDATVLAAAVKRAKNQTLATINKVSAPDANVVRLYIVQDNQDLDYPNIGQATWDELVVDINREWCRLMEKRAGTFKLRDYHRNNREATIISEDIGSTSFLKAFVSVRGLKALTQSELLRQRKKTFLFTGALHAAHAIRNLWNTQFLNDHVLPTLRRDLHLEEDNILRLQNIEDRGDTRLFYIVICEETKKKWFLSPPEGQFHLRLGLNIVKFTDYAEKKSLVNQQVEVARRRFEERHAAYDQASEKSPITPSYRGALLSNPSLNTDSGSYQQVLNSAGVSGLSNLSVNECKQVAKAAKSILGTEAMRSDKVNDTSTVDGNNSSVPSASVDTLNCPDTVRVAGIIPLSAHVSGHDPDAMETISGSETRKSFSREDSPQS